MENNSILEENLPTLKKFKFFFKLKELFKHFKITLLKRKIRHKSDKFW